MTLRKKSATPLTHAKPATATPVLIRSEGQRLLLDVPAKSTEIARSCAVTKQAAGEWRSGQKSPGPASRAALWNAYGIPAHAWSRVPMGCDVEPAPGAPPPTNGHAANGGGTNGHAPAPPDVAPVTEHAAPNSIRDTDALITKLRRTAAGEHLLPADIIRLADSESKLLALRHRMQRDQELLEDKIVREHPAWERIQQVLSEVLAKHPLAAADVAEALQRLDMGTL